MAASPKPLSMDDALTQLLTQSKTDIGLDAIVKGVDESLKFMEPWNLASSEHPGVSKFIQGVQTQGRVYCQAIVTSVKTAEGGYAFSMESIDLCKFLLDEGTKAEALKSYIQEMRETAISAHRDATESSEAFSSVRTGLFELAKLIPGEVAKLTEAAEKAAHKRESFFGRLFVPKPRDLSMVVRSKGRPPVTYDSGATMAELHGAMECLMRLTKSVDAFADWWLSMDTALSGVETSLTSLKVRPQGVSQYKVESVRTRWETLGDNYKNYKLKIIRLRDLYQFTLTQAPLNNN